MKPKLIARDLEAFLCCNSHHWADSCQTSCNYSDAYWLSYPFPFRTNALRQRSWSSAILWSVMTHKRHCGLARWIPMKIFCWLVSTVTSTAGALTSPHRYVKNSHSNAALAKTGWWLYVWILWFSLWSWLMLQFLQESHAEAASERKGKQSEESQNCLEVTRG